MWAESEEGRGSTFIVVLPSLTRTLTEPVRPRVLLLDDEDQEWVRPASDELRARGYEPVRVSTSDEGAWSIDGQAAVGIVSRGGAAVRSLRNLRDRPSSVPVIVVGASGESTDLLAALREELPGIRPRRVLIVEDDADLGEVLVALVERHADVAQVVHSGRQAVEAVDRLEPDLVLLDLQIPDQDGFAVIERLRRAGRLDRTALVVYTALDLDPRDRARLESSGVSVVDKGSTSPEALGAQLARLLDTASGVRTLTAP
jgi:CheY-like chemotaxis protein